MLSWTVNKYDQFVNNLFIVVMQRMFHKISKRTLTCWLKYWFRNLLQKRSLKTNIM